MNHQSYLFFLAVLKQPGSPFHPRDHFPGEWDLFSNPNFNSPYYEWEMGPHLIREFYVDYSQKYDFSDLIYFKKRSKCIESELSNDGKRSVNLDPGLIGLHQVVVSTFKNYSHRIPIEKDIFVDLQLTYSKNSFEKLAWTYPDYEKIIPDFNLARKRLLKLNKETNVSILHFDLNQSLNEQRE